MSSGNSRLIKDKLMTAEDAASLIGDGITVATGGFAAAGYPKAVLHALAERAKSGDPVRINLLNSSNLGAEIESECVEAGVVKRLTPFQMTPVCAAAINKGCVEFVEMPLSRVASAVRSGSLGKIDVAVIEALRVSSSGELILTSGVGLSPLFVDCAERILIEVNSAQAEELEGMHDIYRPETGSGKAPIPLRRVGERIGSLGLSFDPRKIIGIVETEKPGVDVAYAVPDASVKKLADNLFNFLEFERGRQRWKRFPPIQSGIGSMANSLVLSFEKTDFRDLEFFCGLLQEANIELLASGRAICASGCSVHTTYKVRKIFASDPRGCRERIVLRPLEVSNCAEIIDRMQIISMNSAVEVDIYGNANLSHTTGGKVVNGTGGGSTFAHNASLSMMLLLSTGKGGEISRIVPKVTVQDISSHYIDVIVTDFGIADIRGKTPLERAEAIIENCASPVYGEELSCYLRESTECLGGHEPQMLDSCFDWHERFRKTGSMKKGEKE
jgi:succinyl-CoA:acetate CoA-transferase